MTNWKLFAAPALIVGLFASVPVANAALPSDVSPDSATSVQAEPYLLVADGRRDRDDDRDDRRDDRDDDRDDRRDDRGDDRDDRDDRDGRDDDGRDD